MCEVAIWDLCGRQWQTLFELQATLRGTPSSMLPWNTGGGG
jgi:hypothetical protein